ncbi:uncharacterized protein K452DRAFT_330335 [Aplosporella prunicola CBS 121167]|uniref:Uncharacterized protein n=1 Tax=Aplosporella prunicola CBS 121167 TaxID=1176127 RepID=A0A6A6BUV0_9PEZI|nr:uncharacterized protein K452DRAFT_330335 [Aplosporella prunicola CBS 121167]KAF2146994.1 hypothetical protein K452DRAFT_330335 [Aplosporella prunicola CBS 121167]
MSPSLVSHNALHYESGGNIRSTSKPYLAWNEIDSFMFSPDNTSAHSIPKEHHIFEIGYYEMQFLTKLLNELFSPKGRYDFDGIDITEVFLSSNNIFEMVSNITESITNHIRTGPNTTTVNGAVYYLETYVVIRWYWLILPGFLVVLSLIFFILTVLLDTKRNTPPWKSSLVPLLFYGLQGCEEWEPISQDPKSIYEAAGNMDACLTETEKGTSKFVKVERA